MKMYITGINVLVVLVLAICQAASPIDECKDVRGESFCSRYKMYCKPHSRYYYFMEKNCKKFCGICTPYVSCEKTRYKCCPDQKTPADGPAEAGCPIKLCYDRYVEHCKNRKKENRCHDSVPKKQKYIRENCPYSCGFCKHLAPSKTCKDIGFGCCWDGTTALSQNHEKSCRACKDTYPFTCRQWEGDCASGSWRIRSKFMEPHCPQTCGLCPCKDMNVRMCPIWKARGYCQDNASFMKRRCAESCGFCTKRH